MCRIPERRRDAFCGGLRKYGWNVPDSKGTMFVWLPVPEKYTSNEFCQKLLETTGVVGTPEPAFGAHGEGYIRFVMVKSAEELAEIARIIGKSGLI